MRGRKPDGVGVQAAKGNPGKRTVKASVRTEPAKAGAVLPPKWMAKSTEALKVWNEIAPQLIQINLLTALDTQPFARYCRYVAEWITADKAIAKEGTYYDTMTTEGHAKKSLHPAWVVRSRLESFLKDIEIRFGIGPHDRYKILRDQAAVTEGLALWQAVAAKETTTDEAKVPAPADIDPLGALTHFDMMPPGTRPS